MFQIIQRRYWYFALSGLILVPGLLSLIVWGIPQSIDFRGGTAWVVQFADQSSAVDETGIRAAFTAAGVPEVQIVEQEAQGATRFEMRSTYLTVDEKDAVAASLKASLGEYEELLFDSIGPSVGAQVTRSAAIAVALATAGILIYLTIQFRSVPHPVRYGVCAIIAMLHDVLLVLGLASILGHFLHWEVDALFITALLTVIGFSVHDSIVVFDRIRENVGRMRGSRFEDVVNHSVVQTLDRSINTQLTAIFTLFAVGLYTQGSIQRFVFWLIIGFISGTYSSIFNAAPLLVVWENKEWQRWFRRNEAVATSA